MKHPKVLVLGHKQHGKDTFADLLGLPAASSSYFALEKFLYVRLNTIRKADGLKPYTSLEEAFEDRHGWRDTWFREIAAYNEEDPTRLCREMMVDHHIYVGLRNPVEYKACLEKGVFDLIYWVDASQRKEPEPKSSMGIDYDPDTMIYIDNNLKDPELVSLNVQAAKARLLYAFLKDRMNSGYYDE